MANRPSRSPCVSCAPLSRTAIYALSDPADSDGAQLKLGLLATAAYQHFSNLRSTYDALSSPPEPTLAADPSPPSSDENPCCCEMEIAVSEPCEECAQECEQGACHLNELSEQCTDQCVVVPCNDAHHGFLTSAYGAPCDIACPDNSNCSPTDLESFLPCPMDYRAISAFPRVQPSAHPPFGWTQMQESLLQGYLNHGGMYTDSATSTPQLVNSPVAFAPSSTGSSPVASPFHMSAPMQQRAAPQSSPLRCMWDRCGATFNSMNELVGHVNLQHLRLPAANTAPAVPAVPSQPDASALSCLWENCQVYPTPDSVPGPSIGDQTNNILGVLASHLLQDHLGLPNAPVSGNATAGQQEGDAMQAPTISPPASCPPTPVPEHDCSAPHAHVCHWTGCGESFPSCDALTAHITSNHVGSGKAHYDCYWEGCARHGDHGFASKQKICRHLQSHTGHRPFQCKICQQNFSEAATLAQHMRRHTQEKPYVCDFPGCGKSFAITGALTIHKRTHNGHKPFKCTYCDRAFTESSNLSKHLRTHTGARPYHCAEPGCNKTFARPDQLQRHMGVHRKKDGTKLSPSPPIRASP